MGEGGEVAGRRGTTCPACTSTGVKWYLGTKFLQSSFNVLLLSACQELHTVLSRDNRAEVPILGELIFITELDEYCGQPCPPALSTTPSHQLFSKEAKLLVLTVCRKALPWLSLSAALASSCLRMAGATREGLCASLSWGAGLVCLNDPDHNLRY